jgi:hypothetical protein
MAHPVYKNSAGRRLPSVTTVLSRFKDSGALIAWANKEGLEGRPLRGEGSVSQAACDAGTLAHSMVEAVIKKLEGPRQIDHPPETWDAASSAFDAYHAWSQQTRLVPCESEVSLVCECHQLGGTLDAMLIQDRLSLGDVKTSAAVYPEMLLQLSAYGHLWSVNRPDRPITGGYHILRFSKVGGSFSHHYYPNLDKAWELFQLYRRAFDLDKEIKDLV